MQLKNKIDLSETLMQRQLDLEREMQGMGIAKFRQELQEAREKELESTTHGALTIMQHAFEPFCKGIDDWKATFKSGRPQGGRPAAAYVLLEDVKTDVLAFLTMKTIMDTISKARNLPDITLSIANQIQSEINFKEFKQVSPHHYDKVKKDVTRKTRKVSHISTVLKRSAKKDDVTLTSYSYSDKHHIGSTLLSIFIETTGLVEMYQPPALPGQRKNRQVRVQPTEKTTEWLKNNNARCELLSPVFMPMLVPPKDWTDPYTGGFWSDHIRSSLVRRTTNAYLDEMDNMEMWEVYQAVNHLQKTPWKINTKVLEVAARCADNSLPLGNLPAGQEIPLPPVPDDMETNEDAKWLWRKQAASVYGENVRSRSKFIGLQKKLQVAERFKDEQAIYFCYSLDFRGRVYPIQVHLNPQGDDVSKSLLIFAEGKKLDDETGAWLALHGANCFGYDKVNLHDRVTWTQKNSDKILAVAEDPFEHKWWAEADKPWQFLAFCFEWAGFIEDPENFESALPIALDGSCNGLQNFSAMLLDPIGGKATNLTPTEEPQDIYTEVAELVHRKVAASSDPEARVWEGFINRKLVKRPTMTMPYGATLQGYKDQLMMEVQNWKDEGKPVPNFQNKGWEECMWLAQLIKDSLGEVVVAAQKAMDWLQDVSDVISREQLPIYWVTPVGFPVMQNYRNILTKQVKTEIAGKFYKARIAYGSSTTINKRKMKAAISPNFVHSCDAAHMMRTVNLCDTNNIGCLQMVHDSFATHAADTPTLRVLLRHAFVQIHETDPLKSFLDSMKRQSSTPDLLPTPPEKGDLDLHEVLDADFFFS